MAILKDVEVYVTVNGHVLQEHVDDGAEDSLASLTRYIEAESGAEFVVHYKSLVSTKQAYVCKLSVDGSYVGSHFLYEKRASTYHSGLKSLEDGQWRSWPFKFTEIETSEESSVKDVEALKNIAGRLGKLQICILRVTNLSPPREITNSAPRSLQSLNVLPEKALKGQAVSHGTSLGESREVGKKRSRTCTDIDSLEHPWIRFEFRYCSRKALQDMLILPRPSSSVPNLSTEIGDDEDAEESRLRSLSKEELLEMCMKRSAKAKSKRAMKFDDTASPSPRIKHERDSDKRVERPTKLARREPQVIDLLED